MLSGLLGGEELGAGRALRVEEPLANDPGLHVVGLELGPGDHAPEVGVRGGETRGAVGHVGGAAEEEGVVGVGGGNGDGAGWGKAASSAGAEEERVGCRSGRDAEQPQIGRAHV